MLGGEQVTIGHCAINCPAHCPLRICTRAGQVVHVELFTDPRLPAEMQPRACPRGLSLGEWAESPRRLRYPLRRTGPRGSGEFERISWDDAIELACGELERIIAAHGNEAVYLAYGTGVSATTARPFERLLNLVGGRLGRYNEYSNAQICHAQRYMFGDEGLQGSPLEVARDAAAVLAFGASPAETRQGGLADQAEWVRLAGRLGPRAYLLDCRRSDSAIGDVQWVPLRPGTDAALVAAICHELDSRGCLDLGFLHSHCVGFDEDTMPSAYRGRGLSYLSYVRGVGYDRVEKTPEWAAGITGVPVQRIRDLAQVVATARPLYVTQGWGPQRRSNGEWASWAIMALPCLVGQVGLPGTNAGLHERAVSLIPNKLPTGENPVQAEIPAFLFTDAIAHPERITPGGAGLRGRGGSPAASSTSSASRATASRTSMATSTARTRSSRTRGSASSSWASTSRSTIPCAMPTSCCPTSSASRGLRR